MAEQLAFLDKVFLGNTLKAYLVAILFFFGSLVTLYLLKAMGLRRLKQWIRQTPWKYDDMMLEVFEKLLWPLFYVGAFYFSVQQLVLNPAVDKLITALVVIALVIQSTRLVLLVVLTLFEKIWLEKAPEQRRTMASKSMLTILRVVVWGLAVVFILDNLGFNISAVVAGLGIGGVAVALAAQTILGDLFNYFVIFFDKPFEEGDFIIIGEYLGTIEHIGIKTTRIRSLSGEEIVFANSDLTASRIRNYKRMAQRRVLFTLGVVYHTPLEQLRKIPGLIRGIIEGIPDTRFDRAHFKAFGDFNLIVEVVYYVMGADYNKYMDIQQQINFAIKEVFQREGIEFAYPTQTLFLNKMTSQRES